MEMQGLKILDLIGSHFTAQGRLEGLYRDMENVASAWRRLF